MKEKSRGLVLFFVFTLILASCQDSRKQETGIESTTIFLVRHAEKAQDGTQDPPLDSAGIKRAAVLLQTLRDVELTAVYSTPYKRTTETVEAIAVANNLAVTEYDPGSREFVSETVIKSRGGRLFISGHSNTIPAMVNQLIGKETLRNLEDWEYDFLYIINLGNDTTLQMLHYGVPSISPN